MTSDQRKMIESMGLELPTNPDAVGQFDRYLILRDGHRVIEGAFTRLRADHAQRILAGHAKQHGHDVTYIVVELPS